VTDAVWNAVATSESEVTLETLIDRSAGYPFTLAVTMRYSLTDDGINCEVVVSNRSNHDAPVALGAHPFVCVGDEPIRSVTLSSPVARRVLVDERLLPVGSEPVDGSPWDFRHGRGLHDIELDTAFRLGGEAPFVTRLESTNGQAVELWQGPECGWIQFFLTDSFPSPTGPMSAIAIEPMTAPADAFNSGEGLRALNPDERWGTTWGIRLV
jgi:aldose 1-epimerase